MTQHPIPEEHDRVYKQAVALAWPFLNIHSRPSPKFGDDERKKLNHAIDLFDRVLRLNPVNWAAMWLMGKSYQRLGKHEQALKLFAAAHEIKPDQPDVSREASLEAIDLGRPIEAIHYCKHALAAKPSDPGLRANLALATLFSGAPEEAAAIAREALEHDPSDKITQRILDVCESVLAKKRPCPLHVRDLGRL